MSTYDITLTDPLKPGFTIQPGGFDGPGGARSNTTMRLYGRGALEWGEAVDENLARLTETFAGSTPPLNPNTGQLWMRVRYYAHDTSQGNLAGWWQYNLTSHTWAPLDGSVNLAGGSVANTAPTNPSIGSYYYNTTEGVLYRWDTAYKQASAAWLPRAFTAANLSSVAPTFAPTSELVVWDDNNNGGQWSAPLIVNISDTAPSQPQPGTLWYNSTTHKLYVWTGATWSEIVLVGSALTGDLNMGTYRIINLSAPIAATDATTKQYVDVAIATLSGNVSNSGYAVDSAVVHKAGDTMTGALILSGNPSNSLGAATKQYVDSTVAALGSSVSGSGYALDSAVVHKAGDTMSGVLNLGGHKITNMADPTAASDAATKQYVDAAISGSAGGVAHIYNSLVSTNAPGDIAVVGGRIYIALAANDWRCVWPPLYQ